MILLVEFVVDDILNRKVKVVQLKNGYRFSVDPIILVHFVSVKGKKRVIDLGTGTGIIPILLGYRYPDVEIVGIDIVEEFIEAAQEGVKLNKLDNVKVIRGDINKVEELFAPGSFDIVITNPPYMPLNSGRVTNSWSKLISRYEWKVSLQGVVKAASYLLPTKGYLYMIHKPESITRLFVSLTEHNLPPKEVKLVHSYISKDAEFILLKCTKGGKNIAKVLPPLIMYNSDGTFTEEFKSVYQEMGGEQNVEMGLH